MDYAPVQHLKAWKTVWKERGNDMPYPVCGEKQNGRWRRLRQWRQIDQQSADRRVQVRHSPDLNVTVVPRINNEDVRDTIQLGGRFRVFRGKAVTDRQNT